MVCPKCGREINSNNCPYCNNQPVMVNNNYNNDNVQLNNTVPILEQPINNTPVNNQQVQTTNIPVMNQVNNNTVNNNNDNSKIGFLLKYVIVTIVIIILTAIGTYLITKSSLSNNNKKDNSRDLYLDGYVYRLDKSLYTSIEKNRLFISNNLKDYSLVISPSNISFDMYKDNLKYTKNLYIQKGYNIKDPKSKTFNGVEYLTMELYKDNAYELLAITRSDNKNSSYVMIIENGSNVIDYSVLEDVSNIIKNINYESISKRKILDENNMINAHKVLIK